MKRCLVVALLCLGMVGCGVSGKDTATDNNTGRLESQDADVTPESGKDSSTEESAESPGYSEEALEKRPTTGMQTDITRKDVVADMYGVSSENIKEIKVGYNNGALATVMIPISDDYVLSGTVYDEDGNNQMAEGLNDATETTADAEKDGYLDVTFGSFSLTSLNGTNTDVSVTVYPSSVISWDEFVAHSGMEPQGNGGGYVYFQGDDSLSDKTFVAMKLTDDVVLQVMYSSNSTEGADPADIASDACNLVVLQ